MVWCSTASAGGGSTGTGTAAPAPAPAHAHAHTASEVWPRPSSTPRGPRIRCHRYCSSEGRSRQAVWGPPLASAACSRQPQPPTALPSRDVVSDAASMDPPSMPWNGRSPIVHAACIPLDVSCLVRVACSTVGDGFYSRTIIAVTIPSHPSDHLAALPSSSFRPLCL